jgi:hypothetical protein
MYKNLHQFEKLPHKYILELTYGVCALLALSTLEGVGFEKT